MTGHLKNLGCGEDAVSESPNGSGQDLAAAKQASGRLTGLSDWVLPPKRLNSLSLYTAFDLILQLHHGMMNVWDSVPCGLA